MRLPPTKPAPSVVDAPTPPESAPTLPCVPGSSRRSLAVCHRAPAKPGSDPTPHGSLSPAAPAAAGDARKAPTTPACSVSPVPRATCHAASEAAPNPRAPLPAARPPAPAPGRPIRPGPPGSLPAAPAADSSPPAGTALSGARPDPEPVSLAPSSGSSTECTTMPAVPSEVKPCQRGACGPSLRKLLKFPG